MVSDSELRWRETPVQGQYWSPSAGDGRWRAMGRADLRIRRLQVRILPSAQKGQVRVRSCERGRR
jgi:hypothetical protein